MNVSRVLEHSRCRLTGMKHIAVHCHAAVRLSTRQQTRVVQKQTVVTSHPCSPPSTGASWNETRTKRTCGWLTDWLHVQFWQSSSFTLHVCFSEMDILPVIRFKEKHYKKVKIQRMHAEECPVAAGGDVDGEFLIFVSWLYNRIWLCDPLFGELVSLCPGQGRNLTSHLSF